MKIMLFIFLAIFIAACNHHQESSSPAKTSATHGPDSDSSASAGKMKRYWLVLLKKGPDRGQDSAAAEKIQAAHIANIERLGREGKLIMAGPLGIDTTIRGIFLLDCKDSAEVEAMVNTDTAVKTGRLIMEYYPWWTQKGTYTFK